MTATTARLDLAALPLRRDASAVRARIERLEWLLERAITLPGNFKVGLDSIVGLIPVAGDVITGAMGLYLVWEARNLGASRWLQARMLGNVGLDTALGMVPFVGDLFDFVFKSNSKNLGLLKRYLDQRHPGSALVYAGGVSGVRKSSWRPARATGPSSRAAAWSQSG